MSAKVLIIPYFFVYLQPYLTKVDSRHDSTNHASMFLDEPSGKAERVLAAGVLQRTLAVGSDTDDGSLADGENLTVHLILALALQDDVKFLVSLVGVEETAVLTRNERLETQFAACSANGLTCEYLTF